MGRIPNVPSYWRRKDDHSATCRVNTLESIEGEGPVIHITLSDGSASFWFLLGHPSVNPPWHEVWEEIGPPRAKWHSVCWVIAMLLLVAALCVYWEFFRNG